MKKSEKNIKVLKSSALNMVKGGLSTPIVQEEDKGEGYASLRIRNRR